MAGESLFGQVNGQSAVMEYNPIDAVLEVRAVSPHKVIARITSPTVSATVHMSGSDIIWSLPTHVSATLITSSGQTDVVPQGQTSLAFTPADTDEARAFLAWIASAEPRGVLAELRKNAGDVCRLSELTANIGTGFGALSVVAGLLLAVLSLEDCDGWSCETSVGNAIPGVTLGLSGAFAGLVIHTLGRFISVKALETQIRSVPPRP